MPIYVRTEQDNAKEFSSFPISISNNKNGSVVDYSIYGNINQSFRVVDIDDMVRKGQVQWDQVSYTDEAGDGIIGWGNWLLSKGIPNFDHQDVQFIFTAVSTETGASSGAHVYWLKNETSGNMGGSGTCIHSTGTTWSPDWYKSGSVFEPLNDSTLYARFAVRAGGNLAGTKPSNAKCLFFDDYNNIKFLGDQTELGYVISFSVNGTKYDITLDAPLRIALDGTNNVDELNYANQQLIRRVDQNGNSLSEPHIESITLPEITLLKGSKNTITVNTDVLPKSIDLTYDRIEYKEVTHSIDANGLYIYGANDN